MKLYKPDEGQAGDYIQDYGEEATLDDIDAYLAERGMVAVPVEPTPEMERAVLKMPDSDWEGGVNPFKAYKVMIKAAGGSDDDE